MAGGERQQEGSERSQLLASRWQDSCCRVRVQNPERFQPLWGETRDHGESSEMRAGTRQDRAAPARAPGWWHPRQNSGRSDSATKQVQDRDPSQELGTGDSAGEGGPSALTRSRLAPGEPFLPADPGGPSQSLVAGSHDVVQVRETGTQAGLRVSRTFSAAARSWFSPALHARPRHSDGRDAWRKAKAMTDDLRIPVFPLIKVGFSSLKWLENTALDPRVARLSRGAR